MTWCRHRQGNAGRSTAIVRSRVWARSARLDSDYKPGFAAELMMKDTGLSQDAAGTVGAATPLGAHAAELYRQFVDAGGRGKDFSGIIKMVEAMER